jgi:AraC family transcriptional regulator
MDTRIAHLPAVRLVGHAKRVPLIHEGVNPHIAEHVAGIPVEETARLKALNDVEPSGVLAVSDDLDPDRAEGSELTYLHGVATTAVAPEGLDVIEVPPGTWAVFRTAGPHPAALQEVWAATATTWFPSQPWRLRPGPEIVAMLAFDPEAGSATCDLWLPVEPA